MSRIALVGEGPLPGPGEVDTAFAQLRLHQFATALASAHDVHVLDVRGTDIADALRTLRPDAVVTAGTYGPTRAAVAAVADEPLCVDLPGDPFADAQMVADFGASDVVAAEASAVFVPALLRADAFTTIAGPSRHALIGQLGVLGRTARTPVGYEWAHVTPVPWCFPGLDELPRRSGNAPIRVALVGGFNTWFDDETLLHGLLLAMDRGPVEVACFGGAIPGHHTLGWERFAAGVRASRHAARFHLHPRLAPAELSGALARCTVGIVLDRPGYEPELGSRTRLLLYLHQGLSVVATATCELARDLSAGGWLNAVPRADPVALAEALLQPRPPPDRAPLRDRYGIAATTVGLRAWADAPRRAGVTGEASVVQALARERDALRDELDAVRASPTWRALDRLRRLTQS